MRKCFSPLHPFLLNSRTVLRGAIAVSLASFLAACSATTAYEIPTSSQPTLSTNSLSNLETEVASREILIYTLGLLGLNYKFGGRNPEAGLDCSGMVGYIYQNAIGVTLPRTAAEIARLARPIPDSRIRVGDLVFFNTMNRPFSHIGIFIGAGKFVHAPHTHSVIRVAQLDNTYFAARYQGARTLFN